jgi:hypothetical protein
MKKTLNPLTFIKDEIIGSENTFHAWCILTAVTIIVGMGFYLSSPDLSFHGIAGSRESNVNFEYPVEIKRVHVIQGQRVQKGDLLIELNHNELNTQIRQLTMKVEKLRAERSVREQMNNAVGNASKNLGGDPLSVELRELEEERAFLERQRNSLYVFADIDGIVGSVNFKRGEKARSFESLVTISPDSPTFVQGFVNEALRTNVRPGSHVRIRSLTTFGSSVEGKVISVGARFVEVPNRISAAAHGFPVWGREVMVEIPKDSAIILGEKVQISPISSLFPTLVAHADEEDQSNNEAPAPLHVKVPASLADKTSFEASGAVYLPDLKKYLVVSDDTNEAKTPWLFLMSQDGEVDEQPLTIPGVKEVNDMESVSAAGDYLYVMTSLSSKKGSELKKSRSLFLRMKRNGLVLSGTQQVNMALLLRKLIKKSEHPLLQAMVAEGMNKFEVEAHDIRDGALYIGLKAPQTSDNSSLILRVPNVDDVFSAKADSIELEVWKTVKFDGNDGSNYRISDLTFVGNTAYFTTSCKAEACGAVWSLSENELKPKLIRRFKADSPEGIAYNAEKNLFMITFDLGSRGSKFTTIIGPRSAR